MRHVNIRSLPKTYLSETLWIHQQPAPRFNTPKEQRRGQIYRHSPLIQCMYYECLPPRVHQVVEYVPGAAIRAIESKRCLVLRPVEITVNGVTGNYH